MSIENGILGDKKFVVKSLMALVRDESQRIMSLGLASHKELDNLIQPTVQHIIKKAGTNPNSIDVLLGILSDLHTKLASVKLPGDFSVVAADESFYNSLDVPYTGEKSYDLSNLKEEPSADPEEDSKEPEEKELEETLEEYIATEELDVEEDHAEDCGGCMYCFTSAVNTCLKKIAHSLGSSGNHQAAYLVERTILGINNKVQKL